MGKIEKLQRKLDSGGLLTFAELQTLLGAYGFVWIASLAVTTSTYTVRQIDR